MLSVRRTISFHDCGDFIAGEFQFYKYGYEPVQATLRIVNVSAQRVSSAFAGAISLGLVIAAAYLLVWLFKLLRAFAAYVVN